MFQPDNSNDESSLGPDNLDHNTDNSYDSGDNEKSEMLIREQDRFLPIANISRIMKSNIPSNGKISKEAKELVQECVSEFISFITSEASDRCKQEKRKTINGEDIIFAMATLGFDNFIEPLKLYLMKYRDYTMHTTKDLKNLETISNGSLQIHNNNNNTDTNDAANNSDDNNHHFSFS